ncbi:ABC transporter permease [Micromonospora sp. NPDC093277]|uniref:ABC transporter permease n=1 Tax=Micromonospora sp. NPDC093277 TaxID=3364291 RepID=UPI00381369A7
MLTAFFRLIGTGGERRYGTLGHVLLSPRSRTAVFLGRVLPYAGNGLLIAVSTLTVGAFLLGLRIPVDALPALLLTLAVAALACGFFGLTLGALGCGSGTSGWSPTCRWRCCSCSPG